MQEGELYANAVSEEYGEFTFRLYPLGENEFGRKAGMLRLAFGDGCKVALPENKGRKPEVLAYAGKKVIFGIRPNDIHADAELLAKYPNQVIEAEVDMTELLGADTNLYLTNGDISMTAVVTTGTTNCKMGDKVRLCVDTTRVHLFDYDTEKTITN